MLNVIAMSSIIIIIIFIVFYFVFFLNLYMTNCVKCQRA